MSNKKPTKAYELSDDEWRVVLGYRAGEISFSGVIWLRISELELRSIHLMRRAAYGKVTFEVKDGQPVAFNCNVCGHLDKPLIDSQMGLLMTNCDPD